MLVQCFRTLLLFAVCAAPFSLAAEEPARGRLPDGRAYRLDSKGNEIVDYIAELEATNESLNRRIYGLESEVEEKQKQIDRLHKGAAARPLQERDLASPNVKAPAQISSTEAAESNLTARIAELNVQLSAEKEARARENERFADRMEALTAQLQRKTAERNAAASEQIRLAADPASREIAVLRNKVATIEDALAKKNDEIDGLYAQLTGNAAQTEKKSAEVKRFKEEIVALRAQLGTQSGELERVRAENGELKAARSGADAHTKELRVLQNALAGKDSEIRVLQDRIAQLSAAAPPDVPAAVVIGGEGRAHYDAALAGPSSAAESLGQSRMRAIEALKTRLSSELVALKKLIAERDALYSRYTRAGARWVNFKPAPAISARGIGVQEITGRLRAVTGVIEVSALSRDISQIDAKMQEDIRLIQRMLKVR